MNQTQKILLGITLCFLLSLFLFGRPKLHQKEALELMETVLENWQDNNYTFNYQYFDTDFNAPPIGTVLSYEILNHSFDKKSGHHKAYFEIVLTFEKNKPLPSGRTWSVTLIDKSNEWKIEQFEMKKDF